MDGRDLLLVIGILVCSGFGAFVGSYLREKGKNIATKEDIREVTHKIEDVRAQVTGQLWADQERWKFKCDIYRNLLESLHQMNGALFGLANLSSGEAANLKHPLWGELSASGEHLIRTMAIARLFLSEAAIAELDRLNRECQSVTSSTDVAGQARLNRIREPLNSATLRLTETAREDLRFRER